MDITIIREPIAKKQVEDAAKASYIDMTKAVVDLRRGIMALGGEMHADAEASLLEDGSKQEDLWGINLYPAQSGEAAIEYDSMINIRPAQGNRSRTVQSAEIRAIIAALVKKLVPDL